MTFTFVSVDDSTEVDVILSEEVNFTGWNLKYVELKEEKVTILYLISLIIIRGS